MKRLHLLEHDDLDFSRTNITRWAARKGYRVESTDVFTSAPLPDASEFDWLMVMGGSQHAWEEDVHPWLAPEKSYLQEVLAAGKVVIGICFGAQLLAETLGGKVSASDRPEIGWHEVTLTGEGRRSFLFRDLPEAFTTFHWHSDHYLLPPGCLRLAGSPPSENQAFIKPGQPAIGIQFHPEYTRRMVLEFAEQFGRKEWVPGPHVTQADAVITQTVEMPDTYWLMHQLLENIELEFG